MYDIILKQNSPSEIYVGSNDGHECSDDFPINKQTQIIVKYLLISAPSHVRKMLFLSMHRLAFCCLDFAVMVLLRI